MLRRRLTLGDTPADARLPDALTTMVRELPSLLWASLIGIMLTSSVAMVADAATLGSFVWPLTLPLVLHGALRVVWGAARGLPVDPLRVIELRGLPTTMIAALPAAAALLAALIAVTVAARVELPAAVLLVFGAGAAALLATELTLLPVAVAGGLPLAAARAESTRLRAIGGRGDAMRWGAASLLAGIVLGAGIEELGARLGASLTWVDAFAPLISEIARWTMVIVAATGPILYLSRADARLRRGQ